MNRIPFTGDSVRLRLSLSNDTMVGQIRASGDTEWQTVGTCAPTAVTQAQLGICVHGGPEDEAHWAKLSDFAIHS